MNKVKGDLIQLAKDGEFDIIIHGCNCFCQMGAGIAVAIKQNFPAAFKADKATVFGDKKKLGTYSSVMIQNDHGEPLLVVNAYTQYKYGKGKNLNENALRKCFRKLKEEYGNKCLTFAYPMIGCGLAGGNWEVVSKIIEEELEGENHTLVIFGG